MFQVQTHVGPATVIGGWQEAAGVRAGARIGQGTTGVEVRLASGGALLPLPRAGQCLALLPRRSESRADANWAGGRPELEQGLLRRSGAERRASGLPELKQGRRRRCWAECRAGGRSSSSAGSGGTGPNAGQAGDRSSSRADGGGVGPNVARAGGARAAPAAAVRGRTPGWRVTGAQAGQMAAVLGRMSRGRAELEQRRQRRYGAERRAGG
jgi:hypothetical protein